MLLDCWAIPCVLLFTWLFLKTKYRLRKIIGVVICVAGIVTVIFSDVHAGDRAGNIVISFLSTLWYHILLLKITKFHVLDIARALKSHFFAGGSNPIKGDALVIAGATLYAISNVSEVMCVYLFISLGCLTNSQTESNWKIQFWIYPE